MGAITSKPFGLMDQTQLVVEVKPGEEFNLAFLKGQTTHVIMICKRFTVHWRTESQHQPSRN